MIRSMKAKRGNRLRRVAEAAVTAVIGAGAGSVLAHEGLDLGPEWLTPVSAVAMWAGLFVALPLMGAKGQPR